MQKVKNIFIGMFVSIRRRFKIASYTHEILLLSEKCKFNICIRHWRETDSLNEVFKYWLEELPTEVTAKSFFLINMYVLGHFIWAHYQLSRASNYANIWQPYNRFHLSLEAPYCCRISSTNEKKIFFAIALC